MYRGELLGGRFELEKLAASGGMGRVYRALDRTTGRPVAVKVVQHGADAPRFDREIRILSELDHPLIVGYVAHGTLPSGEPYLVTQWLEGEDLACRLSRQRLALMDALKLATLVADALGVLHERGIVHRNLKPGNIFLVRGRIDRIKLLDFRLARIDALPRVTATGELLGTVTYMAPEQARGEVGVDARADIFALGCVLFECLTGERAFAATNTVAVLTRILFQEAPRPSDKLPDLPPAVDGLVARMLAKRPNDRFSDGRAAAEALQTLQATTLSAGPPARLPHSALTSGEQRLVAVILLGPSDDEVSTEPFGVELERQAAAHGGRLERMIDGSTAVVLSGLEVATDLAAKAARCALALTRHAPGRRIALAIGRSERVDRPALGSAADTAGRLLDAQPLPASDTPLAVVTLDETAAGLLDARFDVRNDGGFFLLRGERDVTEVRTVLGKITPCVGRERDLRFLEELFNACVEDATVQALLVTAPAGTGKSRLGREFLHRIRARYPTAAIWIGRADPLRAGSALGVLGQVLRSACEVREGEPIEVRREHIRARVAECVHDSERKHVSEFLGEIAGTPFPDDSLPLRTARSDAQFMNERMSAAFIDFLAAECKRNPVVVLLEDLHWGDRPTVQYIDRALRELRGQPLFVLALARPEVHQIFPKLWAERASQEIHLKGLSRKAIERLVHHVLGETTSSKTVERLARLSEGNAFYLEELIRWAAGPQGSHLPETVVAMVQSRLGALDDPSRRILRAASVFGEVFWLGGVAVLLGGAEPEVPLRDGLSFLVDQELLVRRKDSRFSGEVEYTFRHALLREGAYAMLAEHDLSLGHRLAGQWLEEHGEQDALLLAEHFEKGVDPDRAGRHYLRAAEQAGTGGDSTAAVTYARRGIACDVSDDLHIELLGTLCETQFFQLDLVDTVLPDAEELVKVARQGSAPWVQGMLIVLVCALQGGRTCDFLSALHSILAVEPSADTADPLCLALAVAVFQLSFLGRLHDAGVAKDRLATIARALGDIKPLASHSWHAISAVLTASTEEDPAAGLRHSEAMMTIADAIGHRRYQNIGRAFAGMNQWFLGASADAERMLKEVTMPDEEMGYVTSVRPFSLAWLLADRGVLGEARDWAQRLVASGQARKLAADESRGRWALAEVLCRAGDLDAADAEIHLALTMLENTSPLDRPGALATLAALRSAQGKSLQALAAAEQGLAQYESIGACSLFFRGAFLRLAHAQCLEAAGHHAAACTAIAKAKEHLLVIADKISDPEYRKRFLENVPENRRTLDLARQWLQQQT